MLVTRNSKLIDVFKTPSGHDLLARLFYSLGMDESLIEKKLIGGIKLSSLKYLTFNKFNDEAIDAFVDLLNSFNIEDIDLSQFDRIYVMSNSHKDALIYKGADKNKITVLAEDKGGISDPYGGDLEVYRKCRDELYSAIENSVKEL